MKYTRILMKRNQYPNGYYMIVLTKKNKCNNISQIRCYCIKYNFYFVGLLALIAFKISCSTCAAS